MHFEYGGGWFRARRKMTRCMSKQQAQTNYAVREKMAIAAYDDDASAPFGFIELKGTALNVIIFDEHQRSRPDEDEEERIQATDDQCRSTEQKIKTCHRAGGHPTRVDAARAAVEQVQDDQAQGGHGRTSEVPANLQSQHEVGRCVHPRKLGLDLGPPHQGVGRRAEDDENRAERPGDGGQA